MAKRSKAIVELKKFLKQHGWEYLPDDEQPMLRGLMTGDNGQWHWVATQTHDDRFLMFCSVSPVKVPPRTACRSRGIPHARQLVFSSSAISKWTGRMGALCSGRPFPSQRRACRRRRLSIWSLATAR